MGQYFEQEFTVDSRAVDMFRQCRPSALLGYMQEAATLASLDLGASGPEILAKYNCIWMIARLWVEMDKPLAWNDRFTVRTWHRKTAGASVYRDFDLFQDGMPIGQGVSTWVMADVDSRKLFRMRELAEFQGTDGGELCKDIKLHRVPMPERFDSRVLREMHYSDTDMNGHINNVRYADFLCDAVHLEEVGRGKFVSGFQVCFLSECRAGETIAIDCALRADGCCARGMGPDGKERFECALTLSPLP